jgi:hypothetical protein
MGKNRNRHKTKNKTSKGGQTPKKNYSHTLGDIMKEQGIDLKKLRQTLANEKETN